MELVIHFLIEGCESNSKSNSKSKKKKNNDNCRTRTCAGKAQKISSLSP